MAEKIYYDMQNDVAYRADGTQVANDNLPEFLYKELKTLQIQLLASDSKDSNDDFDDEYTALAAVSVTATAAIDNDAVHYEDGDIDTAIAAAVAIETIDVAGLSTTPRIAGRLTLTNDSDESETINYYGYTYASGVYTFTLADVNYSPGAQTPTYSYAEDDNCRVLQLPIVKDSSVDCTDKATGLFEVELDCNTAIFQELIEGEEEIDNCKIEIQVLDGSGNLIIVKKFRVKCLYLLDDAGGVPPAPSIASDDLVWTDSAKGPVLTARPNGNQYRIWIDDTTPLAPIISLEDYP